MIGVYFAVMARGQCLLAPLFAVALVSTALLGSAVLYAEQTDTTAGKSASPFARAASAASADPGPGDSGTVLNLEGIGAIPGSVLEYRVREPAGDIVLPPRITLLAVGSDSSRYTLQLFPPKATAIFGETWDIGSSAPIIAGTGERSAMAIVKGDEEYVSTTGTVTLRATGPDRFEADIDAAIARVGGSGVPTQSLKGGASGVWTFTCFAVTSSPGSGDSAWGVDGGAVAWFLDESLQSPYCARFRDLVPQ